MKTVLLCFVLAVAVPPEIGAQTMSSDTLQSAVDAGRREASNVSVLGRGISGFGSGVLLGAVAPVAVYGRNTLAIGATVAGVGWLIASAKAGTADPPASLTAGMDQSFRSAFIRGYSGRLRDRRRNAALIGAGAGAAAGVGGLVYFFVRLASD